MSAWDGNNELPLRNPRVAAAVVDLFVYVVVLNLFVEYFPKVLVESFSCWPGRACVGCCKAHQHRHISEVVDGWHGRLLLGPARSGRMYGDVFVPVPIGVTRHVRWRGVVWPVAVASAVSRVRTRPRSARRGQGGAGPSAALARW